jgi:hypothetical protein
VTAEPDSYVKSEDYDRLSASFADAIRERDEINERFGAFLMLHPAERGHRVKDMLDGEAKAAKYVEEWSKALKSAGDSHSLYLDAKAERDRLAASVEGLVVALKELDEATIARFPSFEDGSAAQNAWANRRAKAHHNARAALAKLENKP